MSWRENLPLSWRPEAAKAAAPKSPQRGPTFKVAKAILLTFCPKRVGLVWRQLAGELEAANWSWTSGMRSWARVACCCCVRPNRSVCLALVCGASWACLLQFSALLFALFGTRKSFQRKKETFAASSFVALRLCEAHKAALRHPAKTANKPPTSSPTAAELMKEV